MGKMRLWMGIGVRFLIGTVALVCAAPFMAAGFIFRFIGMATVAGMTLASEWLGE